MATSRVIWNAEPFNARLRGVLQGRAQRAVNIVVGDTQRRVSRPYPPASRPGEPPARRSGGLMRSISGFVTATRNAINATVRARASYAGRLDPGGGRIAKRPFIGLPQDLAKMVRIMTRGGLMATVVDAIYDTLNAVPLFAGRVFRDRPGGELDLPYLVIRGDVEHDRKLDLDGKLRRLVRRIDILDDDGTSSELVEEMAEAAAALFDDDPGIVVDGFEICGVSSQGPADLPPDIETYGRSVLVTLWLEKES